jgi:hypothetical protein
MKGKAFYIIVIILLIVLNIGTLTFLWFNRPDQKSRRPHKDVALFLERKLKMTPSQKGQYILLRENHRILLQYYQKQDQALHNRFFDLIPANSGDSLLVKVILDSIADNRKLMEMLTFQHFRSIRGILDTDQQVRFDKIFDETLKQVLPPPPPPPPPPIPNGGR